MANCCGGFDPILECLPVVGCPPCCDPLCDEYEGDLFCKKEPCEGEGCGETPCPPEGC